MKILVGIMYCIENQFNECIAAIKNQQHNQFDYFIVENLPNKTAHDTLYKNFMNNAHKYDLFIKIDADMVLCNSDFFRNVEKKFENNPKLDLLEVWLHDFFTDSLIGSLNIFRNTVTWNICSETVFVDRIVNFSHRQTDKTELAPAAYHCPNPSLFQAFHFGVHKAVKVLQFGKPDKQYMPACEHWENIEKTRQQFHKTNDIRLGIAVLGAEIAFRKKFTHQEVDFNKPEIHLLFAKYKNYSVRQIANEISRFSFSSFSFLPKIIRRDVLFKIQSRKILAIENVEVLKYLIRMMYYSLKMKLLKSFKNNCY